MQECLQPPPPPMSHPCLQAVPRSFRTSGRGSGGSSGSSGSSLSTPSNGWGGDVRGCWDGNQSSAISDKTDRFLFLFFFLFPGPDLRPPLGHKAPRFMGTGNAADADAGEEGIPIPSRAPRSTSGRFPRSLDPQPCRRPSDPGETPTSVLRAHERKWSLLFSYLG
jgi:hypothetical protein